MASAVENAISYFESKKTDDSNTSTIITKQPMIVSLLGSCVFRIIWVFTVCPLFPGQIMALYISYPISWIVTGGVHFLFCVYFYKKLMRFKKQAEQTAVTA